MSAIAQPSAQPQLPTGVMDQEPEDPKAGAAREETGGNENEEEDPSVERPAGSPGVGAQPELPKGYRVRKQRHVLVPQAIDAKYLDDLLPMIQSVFAPQKVVYNGGVEWANSCYMDVQEKMKPATMPCVPLKQLCLPLLKECDRVFTSWYEMHHGAGTVKKLTRLQSFVWTLPTLLSTLLLPPISHFQKQNPPE